MVQVDGRQVDAAVRALRAGHLVAFPTETVYGLGASAADPVAVARIFALKGRPADHPVIVHIADPEQLGDWVAAVPPVAAQLAARFWPGPLTLILPKAAHVDRLVTGGQDSIGIRIPAHPVAQQLLRAFGGGIAAPSANRYGHVSATRAAHVREEFGDLVPIVLDGGETPLGVESTIVSCLGNVARLLRPGHITRSQLEAVVGVLQQPVGAAPRASGDRAQHYAPRTPLQLVAGETLHAQSTTLAGARQRIAVLALHPPAATQPQVTWINAGSDSAAYAHALYDNLRTLDRLGCSRILVEVPPVGEQWGAVLDRLQRAATP